MRFQGRFGRHLGVAGTVGLDLIRQASTSCFRVGLVMNAAANLGGAPRKSWKDQLRRQLTAAGIPQKKTGKTLPETGLAGEQLQSGRQRPSRQRERKPLRRNADE